MARSKSQKAIYKAEYSALINAIHRCHNEKHISYKDYGARGIQVCKRWRESFADFLADMGPKPRPDLTLYRIDPRGHYEPANCRWGTRVEQAANRRSYRPRSSLTVNGETHSYPEWAKITGISLMTIRNRIAAGRTPEEIIQKGRLPTLRNKGN